MKNKEYRIQDTDLISLSAKRSVSETVCQQSGLSGEAGLPTIVGITGGIGSGKSTIARELSQRGFAVYDCDRAAKRIIAENKDVQAAIIRLLGPEAFREVPSDQVPSTKVYNTAYVAQRVFDDAHLLTELNAIIHPAVKADICQRAKRAVCQQSGLSVKRSVSKAVLFIESAILFEAGLDTICDKIIVIEAPEEVRIARTIERDYGGVATEENINKVRARMRAQKSPAPEKTQGKYYRVANDGRLVLSRVVNLICDIATR